MNNIQIDMEFTKINSELNEKCRFKIPYPKDVVRMKELLLAAQVDLAELLYAKRNKNKEKEALHTVQYKTKIKQYFSCKMDSSFGN
jgi:hypothetical protein